MDPPGLPLWFLRRWTQLCAFYSYTPQEVNDLTVGQFYLLWRGMELNKKAEGSELGGWVACGARSAVADVVGGILGKGEASDFKRAVAEYFDGSF